MKTDTSTTKAKPSQELQAVLEHQVSVSKAQQEVKRLQALKETHQAQIDQATKVEAAMGEMVVKMQDLRADIAAGESKQAELDELQEAYAAASNSLGDAIYDVADDVLAGLDRKIERTNAELARLQAKRPELMRAMLMQQAEAMGAEYAEVAQQMIKLHHRLCAMNHLLLAHGRSLSLTTGATLEVPLFELESVRPFAALHNKTHMVRPPLFRGELMPFDQAEIQRLSDLGVDMSVEAT